MRLALAQINSVVGDIDGNAASVIDWLGRARDANADLVLFPELVVTGYPPEDLLLRPGFVRAARRAVDAIAKATHGITVLVGAPHLDSDLYNACFVLADGEVRGVYRKRFLPNYGVFDEDRYFAPAERPDPAAVRRRGRRADDLRGHLAARAARDRSRARGRAADREHLRVAVPRRQGPRARGDAAGARDRQLVLRRALQRRRRPGRARSSTGTRSCSTTRARCSRARRASRRSCSSSTSTRPPRSAGGSVTCGDARWRVT